jgi:hypothetical protein
MKLHTLHFVGAIASNPERSRQDWKRLSLKDPYFAA